MLMVTAQSAEEASKLVSAVALTHPQTKEPEFPLVQGVWLEDWEDSWGGTYGIP